MNHETPLLSLLSRTLDLAAQRHTLIASNLANIDTPGYRTRDLDFAAELRRSLGGLAADSPRVMEVEGLPERPDGNNVSLDRETLLLAQTQLQFQTATHLLRAEFRLMSTAINEGRSS